jgi:hypothetical protein
VRTNELKGKIVAAGFSQHALAMAMSQAGCKTSKNTLSKKVNGLAPFNTDEVICLCDLLNIRDNDEKAYIFLQ